MSEFGENLRKARERKGITQQTLAEQLYVTRQAVSRWECGARFPDLMTAKKLSTILSVSIDELLSGEELKECMESEPIINEKRTFIVQVCLYGFAMCFYGLYIIDFSHQFLPLMNSGDTSIWTQYTFIENMLIFLILLSTFTLVINKKFSPKHAGISFAALFAVNVLTDIIRDICFGILNLSMIVTLFYIIAGIIIYDYFCTKHIKSPIPAYCCILTNLLLSFAVHMQYIAITGSEIPLILTLQIITDISIYVMMFYQIYILNHKRRNLLH